MPVSPARRERRCCARATRKAGRCGEKVRVRSRQRVCAVRETQDYDVVLCAFHP